jgi:hypothetical protein
MLSLPAILLSRFRINEEEIKQAIIAMDETVLSSENVNALLYIAPKDEEVRALRTFKEKLDPTLPLGKVERFIFAVPSPLIIIIIIIIITSIINSSRTENSSR